MGDMELGKASSGGTVIQPSHKTFNLQIFLSVRFAGIKVVQNLWEWITNDGFNLKPIPLAEVHV